MNAQGHAKQRIIDGLGARTSWRQGTGGDEAQEPFWVALRDLPGNGGSPEAASDTAA